MFLVRLLPNGRVVPYIIGFRHSYASKQIIAGMRAGVGAWETGTGVVVTKVS